MKTINTRGYTCPRPLIMLKEGLEGLKTGEEVKVITDNETSLSNLVNYLNDHGAETNVHSEGPVHTISTRKPDSSFEQSDPAAYCCPENDQGTYVVSISRGLMGDGDPELGKVLMETFLDHLKLQENLPTHIVLYNGGVKLAMKGTATCQSLNDLEEIGCRVMLCGTCVDHYGIQFEIGVGMISNMVTITETLAATGHVVSP